MGTILVDLKSPKKFLQDLLISGFRMNVYEGDKRRDWLNEMAVD